MTPEAAPLPRPTGRLYLALGGWCVAGGAASIWPLALPVWAGLGALLLGLTAYDALALRRQALPLVERTPPSSLAVGVPNDVHLQLKNGAGRALRVDVFDHHPSTCPPTNLPQRVTVPQGGWARLTYQVTPHRRGEALFARTALMVRGRLGLVSRHALVGSEQTVRVYPNFKEVVRFALLALADRVGQMGIRTRRRRGEGLEFEQLREYREGDLMRQVDWKATARRRKLISREYQDEKNQQIVFLLDCGRRMRAKDGDMTHFDHVLNAVLLLGYVALRQGDAVGFMTFSGSRRWLPPTKGGAGMSAILNQLYDLETSVQPSDYLEAARRLMARQKRRALVILVTNLRDEDDTELMPALMTLRRRNLVLLASLREEAIRMATDRPIQDLRDALFVAEGHRFSRERHTLHEKARQGGTQVLDVEPQQLPVSLVNRYLDIKRTGRL
ncbi:MAG: DUF58 domain-containing protein [Planctomycetota bacterium]